MEVKPSQAVTIEFSVEDANGAIDADATPTGVLVRNGTDLGTTVTVTWKATGRYKAEVTIPADWAAGDTWTLRLLAVVDGYNFYGYVNGTVDTKRTSDLQDLTQANIRTAVGLATANLDAQFVTVNGYVDCLPASWVTVLDAAGVRSALGMTLANLDTQISGLSAYVDCLPASWVTPPDATIFSGITSLANWLRMLARSDTANATAKTELNSGGGTYGEADDSLQAIQAEVAALAAIGSGGSYSVTVTVTSGGVAVQGATVKIKDGSTVIDTATTNVSGVAIPTANAGTYTLVVSYPGFYASSSQSLVVDADETVAVSLTALSIAAPSAPNLTTGYVVCYGTNGLIEASVTIYPKMVKGVGTDAYSHDTATITLTSDATGLAQHAGFIRGAEYIFSRGTAGRWTDPEVAPNTATWALPEILGYS